MFEALKNIFLLCLSRQEDDGDFRIDRVDLLCQGETVFLRHHHVQYTQVILPFCEALVSGLAIGEEVCLIPFRLQVLSQEHT